MIAMREMWSQIGSIMASAMFVYAVIQQYFPYELERHFDKYLNKVLAIFYPYIEITFHEYTGEWFMRSEVYDAIQSYLSSRSSARAKRLKAGDIKDKKSLVLSLDDYEEVSDEFHGIELWWTSHMSLPQSSTLMFFPNEDERRHYTLKFHRRHRDLVTSLYLSHVIKEGKGVQVKNRQRKLYTNGSSENWNWYTDKTTKWTHVKFEHPATFDTLAMDPRTKKEIVDDLVKFQKGKEYYNKVGKAWKRGYLLYGPPGTGKSTMVSAMANFLDYDVYDLELTAVKDNTELRKLLIDTSSKSIIVIEDIDCSLDLTGQRDKKKKKDGDEDKDKDSEDAEKSKVTLSGLLNFIDGIWSACGGERVIVFTTNHVDKLDPALIRRGRMDKHIELSYCGFEAFKVLARNYLDEENHETFSEIERLLGETDMSPADVAENLMPKSDEEDSTICLKRLIESLEKAKKKAEEEKEEAKAKAEKEKTVDGAKEEVKREGACDDKEEKVEENGSVTS